MDGDLTQESVRVLLEMNLVNAIQHHKLVLICELGGKHSLEELLHLALLARGHMFQVLEHSDKTRHALSTDQVQGTISDLIDGVGGLVGITLQSADFGSLATHTYDNDVGNFASVENRVRVVSIDLKEDQALLPTRKVR